MAASLFTSETAKALKETLEACSVGEFQRAALTGDVTASANSNATTIRWIAASWVQFLLHGDVSARYRDGEWRVVCECGSGSNAIGPGHSDWCGCYRG